MLPSYAVRTLLALNDRHGAGITRHRAGAQRRQGPADLADVLDRPDFHLVVQDVGAPDGPARPARLRDPRRERGAARAARHRTGRARSRRTSWGPSTCSTSASPRAAAASSLMSSARSTARSRRGAELDRRAELRRLRHPRPTGLLLRGQTRRGDHLRRVPGAVRHRVPVVRFGHIYGPGMALDDGRVQADFAANVVPARHRAQQRRLARCAHTRTWRTRSPGCSTRCSAAPDGLQRRRPGRAGVDPAAGRAVHRGAAREGAATALHQRVGRAVVQPDKSGWPGQHRLAGLGWRAGVDLTTGLNRMVTEWSRSPSPIRPELLHTARTDWHTSEESWGSGDRAGGV